MTHDEKPLRFGGAHLEWIIGEVVDERSWSESHVSGSGGGGGGVTAAGWGVSRTSKVKVTTEVKHQREIFVKTSDGREYSFFCPQDGVTVRAGHRVACVFLDHPKHGRALIRLHNDNTQESYRTKGDGEAAMFAHPGHGTRIMLTLLASLIAAPFTAGATVLIMLLTLPIHAQFWLRKRAALGGKARHVLSVAIEHLAGAGGDVRQDQEPSQQIAS